MAGCDFVHDSGWCLPGACSLPRCPHRGPRARDEAGAGSRKKHTLRFILGVLVAASGSALVAYAWRLDSASQKFMLSFGGALVALLGAVVAVSVLLPALTRAFGVVFPGMLSAMARENTMRNPGRTSATGSAILIGVTLVVTIMVGAASVRTTLTNAVNDARPFDLIAVSTTGERHRRPAGRHRVHRRRRRHRCPVRRPRRPDPDAERLRLRPARG